MTPTPRSRPTAKSIAEALACGEPGCPCQRTAQTGKGDTHCPAHSDRDPSLSISEEGGKVLVHCQAECSQGAVIAALKERKLWPSIGDNTPKRQSPKGMSETVYPYVDEAGTLLYEVVRRPDKTFLQRRPDGKGGWLWNLGGVRRVPYRLSELLAASRDAWAFVVEGEKDCDRLVALGLVATTNSGGAGKFLADFGPFFEGRKAAILPDNDAPGQAHAQDAARRLAPYALVVKIIDLPGLSPKGDVSDWLDQGHTAEELLAMAEETPKWQPPPPPDLAALLDGVVTFIRRFVVVGEAQVEALALWVAHTWVLEAAETTPYLSIRSVEKRSGKTRLLEVLALLAHRAWFTGRVTAAVLVRKVDKETPTLLLDESDAAFKGEKEFAETLRSLLNSGYRRGGVASLCVKQGGDIDLRDFSVFGPKAIAGMGKLPDTVADRSITIELRRRAPNETVARFRQREAQAQAGPIREALERWAAEAIPALAEARPDIPQALDDRAADGWEPLLAIADMAGGEWPQRARRAALSLSAGDGREDDSLGVRLLGDLRGIFGDSNADRLPTADLVAALVAMEEAPWGDLKGKALDARTLARMLKPYGVHSGKIRFGEKTAHGFHRADFADSWNRYIPPQKGEHREQGEQTTGPLATETKNVPDVPHVPFILDIQAQLSFDGDGPPAEVCAVCGGPLFNFTPNDEPRCQAHAEPDEFADQSLALMGHPSPLLAYALSLGCTLDTEPLEVAQPMSAKPPNNCPSCNRPWPRELIKGRMAGCRTCAAEEDSRLEWARAVAILR